MTASAAAPSLPRGWRLAVHAALPSTSDLCRALAQDGAPALLAVQARQQVQGRGSKGRHWESPEGNLYISVLLRPPGPAREASQWSLLAGVAVAEAVVGVLGDDRALALKWPNDLLLGGAKLAGILVDSSAAQGALDWVVIGIGINLALAPTVPDRRTACLGDVIAPPPPTTMAALLLARLEHWRGVQEAAGFAPVRDAWAHWGARLPGFAGLAADGSLLAPAGTLLQAEE
ncbi:MAG: biotin--[acetyl-CoA-carboxylase] ligase [Rhodospirillales bacterium 70-18]|nr:MAG: biotin--[acetyl-CoA-carboxylase] ligase [Rhodospirillales bacterium 70-18]